MTTNLLPACPLRQKPVGMSEKSLNSSVRFGLENGIGSLGEKPRKGVVERRSVNPCRCAPISSYGPCHVASGHGKPKSRTTTLGGPSAAPQPADDAVVRGLPGSRGGGGTDSLGAGTAPGALRQRGPALLA